MDEFDPDRALEALRAADSAGDTAAATAIAGRLREWQTATQKQQRLEQIKMRSPTEYMDLGKYSPIKSGGDNVLAGIGKAYMDIGRGAQQLVGSKSREEIDESRHLDRHLMNTKGGIGGNIAGNVAIASPAMFVPGANTYVGSALIGGGFGALQPVGTGDSRLSNAALGVGGGLAGRYIGGKIGDWAAGGRQSPMSSEAQAAARAAAEGGESGAQSSVSGSVNARLAGGGSGFGSVGDDASASLSRAQAAILARGKELGMRQTPGNATGSKALQQFEAKLQSQPMTSGPFHAIDDANQKALNREVAASIGEAADTVDNVVLERASSRLNNVFESAKDEVARPIDAKSFLGFYSGIKDELRGIGTAARGFDENDLVNDLVKLAKSGSATGKQLQPLTSKLGKAAYREMTTQSGDRELGQALYRTKEYVDDLLESGMTGKQATRFNQARGQYRNLMNILSRTNIVNPSNGNVSGRALAQMLQQKDRGGFTMGRNRTGMYDAARFYQAFPPVVGNSGTATRSMVTNPLELMLSVPFNAATRAYASAPSVSAFTAANAASRAASPALRKYLGTAPYYAPYLLPSALPAATVPLLGQ